MKNVLYTASLVLVAFISQAQNTVNFSVNHYLGQADFSLEMPSKNNLDMDFEVTRLEYYLSGFAVVHDGGQETAFPEAYMLVNGAEDAHVELGGGHIEHVEKIKFSIGVDQANNHADPALFPSGHPLAPKFPSMHWGWAAGYRFIAMEGNGGKSLNQLFQLHGLGDNNYFEVVLDVDVTADQGEILIEVDADYTRVLEDINVAAGVIVHGDNMEAQQALMNMRDFVFEPSESSTSTANLVSEFGLKLSPNPSIDGNVRVFFDGSNNIDRVVVFNSQGQEIKAKSIITGQTELELTLDGPGMYWVKATNKLGQQATATLVVK